MAVNQASARRVPSIEANEVALALGGWALALVIIVAGNYHVAKGENGGTGPALFSAIVCTVLAVALFGFVVPRIRNADRALLIIGVVAVVGIIAFWLGIHPILAATALAIAQRTGARSRKAMTGQALAGVAALGALVISLANSHLF